MERHTVSDRTERGVEDEEERLGLLHEDDDDGDEKKSQESEFEELDWDSDVDVRQPRRGRWLGLWLKIVVVSLLVAFLLGFAIHFMLSRRKDTASTSAPSSSSTPVVSKLPALRPEEEYILDPKWDFDAASTTREYHWNIEDHDFNPDGVYRPMILINGMFPGPLIECNEGDEIVVHVHNKAVNATSFHWHGLYQNGTNWMDGTVGVTQCPIAPGQSFTYQFTVDGQSGTYWYHSHVSVQASDGLVGPIVIHAKNEKELQNVAYQEDRVVMVSDHYYDLSSSLLMQYLAPDSENSEPVPASALINGRNVRDCSKLPKRNCNAEGLSNILFDLSSDQNTRLRIINVGAFAEFQIQIDEHEFSVTEVDGTDVLPQSIHRLNINPAQRYSIIVTPPNPNKGLYWLRARMITHCFAYQNPELSAEVRGAIRYWPPGESVTPQSLDWPEVIELVCRDLNTSALEPVVPIAAPATADDQIYLRSNFEIGDWRLSRGFLNQSSFRANPSSPSLNRVSASYSQKQPGYETLDSIDHGINSALFAQPTELVYQTTQLRTLDILIQNFDDGNHPFHLHGYKFWVLGQGHGYPPADLYDSLDLRNPLRRDTASVEAFGWTLIRFVADNPGMWAFHCHISWHSEAGLMMQFLTRAEEVARFELPGAVTDLCKAPGLERGMGPDDGLWVGDFGTDPS